MENGREYSVITDVFDQICDFDELMKAHGAQTCALESMSLTLEQAAYFRKLKNVEFLTDNTLSQALYDLRTVKTPAEIEKIRAAQQLAEAALDSLLGHLHAGMTERETALALEYHMKRHGAEDLSFDTIALTGAHTSMPHGVPDDRVIQQGDFVLMDFGAVVDGYHSDMTRTVCVGRHRMQHLLLPDRVSQEKHLMPLQGISSRMQAMVKPSGILSAMGSEWRSMSIRLQVPAGIRSLRRAMLLP